MATLMFNMKIIFCMLIINAMIQSVIFAQSSAELDLEDLTMKARQKAFELGENLSKIANKTTSKEAKRILINSTMNMFKDGNCKIEVTSLRDSTHVRKEPIRKYLNRISDFPIYSKVELEWNQVHVINKIHKDQNGDYWGVIRIIQKFKGMGPNGEDIYKDVTEKEIEVKLENYKVEKGAKTEDFFVLKFGDVKVIEVNTVDKLVKP